MFNVPETPVTPKVATPFKQMDFQAKMVLGIAASLHISQRAGIVILDGELPMYVLTDTDYDDMHEFIMTDGFRDTYHEFMSTNIQNGAIHAIGDTVLFDDVQIPVYQVTTGKLVIREFAVH